MHGAVSMELTIALNMKSKNSSFWNICWWNGERQNVTYLLWHRVLRIIRRSNERARILWSRNLASKGIIFIWFSHQTTFWCVVTRITGIQCVLLNQFDWLFCDRLRACLPAKTIYRVSVTRSFHFLYRAANVFTQIFGVILKKKKTCLYCSRAN